MSRACSKAAADCVEDLPAHEPVEPVRAAEQHDLPQQVPRARGATAVNASLPRLATTGARAPRGLTPLCASCLAPARTRACTRTTPAVVVRLDLASSRRGARLRQASRRRPVLRVAVADDGRLGGVDHEPVRPRGEQLRAVGGGRVGARAPPRCCQRGDSYASLRNCAPALEHQRLGARGVVQRRVGQRDPADRVLAQPVVVARRRSAARRRRRSGWPSGRAGAPSRARAGRPWPGPPPPSGCTVIGTSTRSPGLGDAWRGSRAPRPGRRGGCSGRRAPRRRRAPRAATAGRAARRRRPPARAPATRLRCASASTDGPASTPSRSAFCPNGDGTTNAPTSTPRYSSPPAHSVRRPGASSATPAAEITSIGQNAVAAKRSVPPSGNSS